MQQPALSVFRVLRQTAPAFRQDAFVCRRSIQTQASSPQCAHKSLRNTPFLQAFRSQRSQSAQKLVRHKSTVGSAPVPGPSSLGEVGKRISQPGAGQTAKKSFFPETSSKSVAYWLLGSAASVFGIVVFGGLTRLTESGCVSLNSISSRAIMSSCD